MTNTAYLGDELRTLRDTLGLTDLGRAFMEKHGEIFGAPPSALEAKGVPFDPTNHHNALKCPYCNPQGLQFATAPVEAKGTGDAVQQPLPTRSDIGNIIRDALGKKEGWLQYLPAADAILNYCAILRKQAALSLPVVTGGPAEYLRDEVRADGSISTDLCDKTDPGAYPVYRALPAPKAAGDESELQRLREIEKDYEALVALPTGRAWLENRTSGGARAAVIEAFNPTDISDEAMRELLSSTNVGQGRARLRKIIRALSTPSASAGPQAEAVSREALARAWLYGHCAARGYSFTEIYYVGCKGSKLWHDSLEIADRLSTLYAHPQPQQADGRGAVIDPKRLKQIQALAANWKDIASDEEAAPTGSMLKVINELLRALSLRGRFGS